jgi:molecular chaperone DnaK
MLIDVTPYTFGTSAVGELDGQIHEFCFVPLIRKNTPIPVTKSEVFFTMMDHQPEVRVTVYQGEDRDALNNIKIGEFMVSGLSKVPAGNPIVLGLSLDLNGILEVTALEKNTGLARSITITGAMGNHQADKVAEARDRVQALFGGTADDATLSSTDQAEAAQRRASVEVQAMIEKAERALASARPEDAEDLVDAIEATKDAVGGDAAALKQATDALADLLYYLEV